MPIDETIDEQRECEFRLEVARDMLELSTELFNRVTFVGPREALESAYADLRFARVRFLAATAEYREIFS